jgi:hypothetical protein
VETLQSAETTGEALYRAGSHLFLFFHAPILVGKVVVEMHGRMQRDQVQKNRQDSLLITWDHLAGLFIDFDDSYTLQSV